MGQIGSFSLEFVCSSDDSPGHSWHGFMKWTGPPPMRVEGFGFVDVSAALSRSSRTELLLLLVGAIIFDGSAARNGSSHRVFLLRFISGIAAMPGYCPRAAMPGYCPGDIRVDGRDILLRYSQSNLANLATRSDSEPGHTPITSPLD